jgi:ligand-binding sensor domain-containing protein
MNSLLRASIFLLAWILSVSAPASPAAGITDSPFVQEYHEAYPIGLEAEQNDVRAITVDGTGDIWAGTKVGVFRFDSGKKQWAELMGKTDAGPVYDIVVDHAGTVWIGTWNGIYKSTQNGLQKLKQIDCPIAALCVTENEVIGLGGAGIWSITNDTCIYKQMPYSRQFRAVIAAKSGGLWIATGNGLYHHTDTGYKLYQTESELLGPDLHDIAYAQDGSLWIGGLGGITVYKDDKRINSFTPAEGLPSVSVRCVAQGPDGQMWVGTDHGIARYNGKSWSIRHSKRWLLSDDVRDIAFDSQGTAWIATDNGISAIKRKSMSLA